MNRRTFLRHAALTGLLAVGAGPFAHAATPKKMNVLILLSDDQSAHLECLGTKGISTPHTTELARTGINFTNAFSTSASCSPTRSGILTGMYPHSNGHWRNTHTPSITDPQQDYSRQSRFAKIEPVGIHEDIPTLVEILNDGGYETAITNKFHLSPVWKYPFKHRFKPGFGTDSNSRMAARFFKDIGEKPFFMLANLTHTHRPFKGHPRFVQPRVNPQAIDVPEYLPDTPGMRKDLARYFDTVQSVDATVGAIIKTLKAAGKYDNTLILFTSDQGFCYHRAKATTYDLGLRVPFIVAGPGIVQNKTDRHLVSHIDLMPTVLDYLGITVPTNVQGRSLRPLLSGKTNNPSWRPYVFAEHNSHGPAAAEFYPTRSVFDGRYHYIRNLLYDKKRWTGNLESLLNQQSFPAELQFAGPVDAFQYHQWGNESFAETVRAKKAFPMQYNLLKKTFARPKEELYDLKNDPYETNNLAEHKQHRDKLEELRKQVTLWMQQTNDPGIKLRQTYRR